MGRGLLPARRCSSSLIFSSRYLRAGRYVDSAQRDGARDYDGRDGGDGDPGVERGGDDHVQRRAEHGRRACHETEEREELAAARLGRDLREEAPGERLAASEHQADRRAERRDLAVHDHEDPDLRRHMMRLWLTIPNGRPLPPVFANTREFQHSYARRYSAQG